MASISKTKSEATKEIIVWAIDPNQNPEHAKAVVQELKVWSRQLNCDILPVSIFTKSLFDWPIEGLLHGKNGHEIVARKALSNYLKKLKTKGFLPPHILFSDSLSNRKMAQKLATYSEYKKALVIFANTRVKKTWAPIRLGGFAETLIATSRIPTLLFNPDVKLSEDRSSILFPTNFSKESKAALVKLQTLAKPFDAKITLFNQVENPTLYVSEFNGTWQSPTSNVVALMKDMEKARIKKAVEWESMLSKLGTDASHVVQPQKKYIAADAIALAKRNETHLIAIASHTSVMGQTLLGSVAQDLLLEAKCPVLVIHNPKLQRHAKPPKETPERNASRDFAIEPLMTF